MARYILDHPEVVAGRRVLDIGAGSGIVALAAMIARASSVVAADIDPLSVAVMKANAALNGLAIEVCSDDLLDSTTSADIVLAGDIAYESPLKERAEAFYTRARNAGAQVLMADRTRLAAPASFRPIAEYDTIVEPALLEGFVEPATIWQAD